jgi:hypothetical protein
MMAQKKLPKRGANSRQRQCQQRPNNADDGKRTARALAKTRPEEEDLQGKWKRAAKLTAVCNEDGSWRGFSLN